MILTVVILNQLCCTSNSTACVATCTTVHKATKELFIILHQTMAVRVMDAAASGDSVLAHATVEQLGR